MLADTESHRHRSLVSCRQLVWTGLLAVLVLALSWESASATAPSVLIDPGAPLQYPSLVNGISCPTVSLCVAVDGHGNVVSTTDPTGPASAWHVVSVDTLGALDSVSCAPRGLCAAGDSNGYIFVSTNPTADAGTWRVSRLSDAILPLSGMANAIGAVSCPSSSLCVALDSEGDVLSSADPLGGASTWRTTRLTSSADPLSGVSCAIAKLCVATDVAGNYLTVTEGISVTGHEGRRVGFVLKLRNGRLTITFAHPVSRTQITISGAALRLSRGLAAALTHNRGKKLALVVEVTDAGRVTTTLSLRLEAS